MRIFVPLFALALAACAPLPTQQPQEPPAPVVHTVVQPVYIPTPVACFTEAERPVFPAPTPIDLATATVEQKAAAEDADARALAFFGRAVDALFVKCMEASKRVLPQPSGGKP
jgi:hypothetical protein